MGYYRLYFTVMKLTKRKSIILGILGVLIILLIGAGEYLLQYALRHDNSNYSVEEEFRGMKEEYPWISEWVDSIRSTGALRDTFITNHDGKKIHAWHLKSPDNTTNTAVIVHGYTSNPIEMMQIGYLYNHDLRWNIMLPDLIAHGQSESGTIQMGWKDRLDVAQWVDVAHSVYAADTMVVHGISMGAATTMCLAGEETPDYLRGFIEDCGYTSAWDEFADQLDKQFHLPPFPLLHLSSFLCKLQYGWSFGEASPLKQVEKCHKPMLFIHGDNDTYVPTEMVYELYDAKKDNKDIWIAQGSIHAHSYKDYPEQYTATVSQFISDFILTQ